MSQKLEQTYTVEKLKVADLLVDKRVQRDGLLPSKVDDMVRNFNIDAVGIIHVSRRVDGDYVIDGWHRKEAVLRVTEGTGEMTAHVYTGLTLPQEADMFLDLNNRTNVRPIEKHKARVTGGDPQALRIENEVRSYGWAVHPIPAPGHVNAVNKLYQLDKLSMNPDGSRKEPSLIQLTFLTITRAWANDRFAGQAVILEGIGRLYDEHGSKIDTDHLVDRLKNYKGGPRKLHQEASQFANTIGGKVSMAVAYLITEAYNKGKQNNAKTALPPWRKRS